MSEQKPIEHADQGDQRKVYVGKGNRQTDSREVDIRDGEQSAKDALESRGVEIDATQLLRTDELEREKFMRDELEIELMEPGNDNEPQFVEVNVNGDYRLMMRDGSPQKCRRYHVAVLAQAKQSRLRQKKVVSPDGSMGFQEDNVLSLSYPFRVTNDPNARKGAPWLRELLRNPG